MSPLEKLLAALERQTAFQSGHDGFPSEEFRRTLLEKIKHLKLGRHPRGICWNVAYSNEEKLKIEYLREAGETGAFLAQKYMTDKILLPSGHFLRAIIDAGMESLGREIACGYALEIYPELRRRRMEGEREPDFPQPQPEQKMKIAYGFTVETDRDIFELGPIRESAATPGSDIYYDDLCDRHIETFVFASIDDADAAHWNWQRFINHQSPRPPVKYAIRIETDCLDHVQIGSVVHADPFEKSHSGIAKDGSSIEWNICASLVEAENWRQKKIDELRKKESGKVPAIETPSKKTEVARNLEAARSHREIPLTLKKHSRNKNLSIGK